MFPVAGHPAREVIVWRDIYEEHSHVVIERMREWFRRHGIDPNYVPSTCSAVYRHCLPGRPGITYEEFVTTTDPTGMRFVDWTRRRVTTWLPMEADPLPFPDLREPQPEESDDRD